MKKKIKTKTSTKSKNNGARSSQNEPQLPDLVSAMMKIAERLESLERKMDTVAGQISRTQNQVPRQQPFQQPHHSNHQPSHNQNRPPQSNQNFQQKQGQNFGNQGNRNLYPAVCADCNKHCEVPFKPTGERPTYCKECFAKRKSGGNQSQKSNHETFGRPQLQPRLVKVTPNGVGKVTISEMVPSQGARGKSKNKPKHIKKSR